jgi:phage-related protein
MKKRVVVHKLAEREMALFPNPIRLGFKALFERLREDGRLKEPQAKRLGGRDKLFELRVRQRGQWRMIYAYAAPSLIIVLSGFIKKTQKTPKREITKSQQRLRLMQE